MTSPGMADPKTGAARAVPFASFVAPLGFVGESVYLVVDGTARGIARIVRWVRTRINERRTLERLTQLDDHILRDIGVDRSEIRYVARGHTPRSGNGHSPWL